jgi:CDP-diacylglycerol pyrophosphatase
MEAPQFWLLLVQTGVFALMLGAAHVAQVSRLVRIETLFSLLKENCPQFHRKGDNKPCKESDDPLVF